MLVGIPTLRDTFGWARMCCWVACLKDSLPGMETRPNSPPSRSTSAILSLHAVFILLQLAGFTATLVSGSTTLRTTLTQPTLKAPPQTLSIISVVAEQCRQLHSTGDALLCLSAVGAPYGALSPCQAPAHLDLLHTYRAHAASMRPPCTTITKLSCIARNLLTEGCNITADEGLLLLL